LADQNAAGFHRFLIAFFLMRDFLLFAKNLFVAATERELRKHFAHLQANGGLSAPRVTVEQVVRELKLIGFSDIRKIVSWRNELVTRTEKGKDGEPVMVLMPRVTIVDADKISDEAAAAVAEVSQTINGALRVKMHDKHAALVSIGRYLGMFDDKVKVEAVYGISEEPMSAEEWNKQFAKAG
jgi:hypothetical protein